MFLAHLEIVLCHPVNLGDFVLLKDIGGGAGKMVIKGAMKIKLLMIAIIRQADNCSSH